MAKKVVRKKKPGLARPFLENDGWTLYHSGGGCIVWCKATTAARMYMGTWDQLDAEDGEHIAPEDMLLTTPCGISISDADGCILNMYFPSVQALIDSAIALEGEVEEVEPANERRPVMTFMRCEHCGASSSCKVCMDHEKDFGHLPPKRTSCKYGAQVCTHRQCQKV